MELYTLNISVSNQKLTFGDNLPEIFSGDQSIDYVQFTFNDSKWDGFTDIWAVFNRYKGRSYQVELESGKAMIPAEVMINGGHVFIGLLGTDGENVQTSSVLEYSIGQGAANADLIAPSESIYEQFLSDLDAYQTAVSELASIESRLTTAETTVQNLESRVTVAETTVSNMEDTVDGLVSDVSGMRTTVDGLQTDVTNLQTSVTALESAVPTLQRDVSALQTGVTNLESRLTAISTSVGSLEDRLTTVQTSLTDLEDGLTDAEGRLTTLGNQITDAQTDIEEIETAIQQNNIVTDVTGGGVSFVNNHIADLSFMTITDTATGSIATFPDGSGLNAVSTEIQIEPKQAGSGTPSPDNVRPISGFSTVTATDQDDTTNPTQTLTTTINLGQTVYGGTLNVESGELVVDKGYVDLGTLTWSTPSASGRMSASAGAMPITSSTDLYNVISDTYATITARSWYNATATGISICGAGYGANGNIGISDPNLAGKTSAEAKSYVTGIHAVYPLATPQVYQLTPQQVQTLNGTNNIWADSGDISLEYIANIKKYIEKRLSE